MTSRPFSSIVCSLQILCGALLAATVLTPPLHAQAPAEKWAKRDVSGLQFESPFELKESVDLTPQLPEAVKEKIASMSSTMGGAEDTFIVFVTSPTYKAGVPVDLDGAVKGAINGIAAKIGDTSPQFTTNAVKVSGLEARKGAYKKSLPDGHTIQLEYVVIVRGQTLWQVQALTMSDKFAPDLSRLINSVEVKAAP